MADIIKTWPSAMDVHSVAAMFGPDSYFSEYYFAIGTGKPKQAIERVFYTYRGRIVGSFKVDRMVINDGSLPRLSSIEGGEWHIKHDAYVLICASGYDRLKERLFMSGFRGWRYFNLDSYRQSPASQVRL